ncbi:MAG: alkaline phosphatase family protein [Nitrospirota bacterium]
MKGHHKLRVWKKVVVLGLDGVPCSLLNSFIDEGVMPNFARLKEEGTLCSMTVSIPEVSSTSWSTFMTGVNPGRHGIYGFMELQKENYSWRFPNFNDLKSKTIWEIAGDHGKRSIVLNIPSTYPVRPLNGMLVSGFVALDLKKASFPEKLYQYLSNIGYRLDVDAKKASKSIDEFTDDIMQTFRKRKEAINYLYESEEWDLFIACITETDRLHHYLWNALDDSFNPYHDFFLNFYRELDEFIGTFYSKIDLSIPFIILSDHGFTGIKKEIYLNAFLREKGYLRFTKEHPATFEDIDHSSRAFILDPSRIYIHLKGKYAHGYVDEDLYEILRSALREDLLSINVNGEKVIKEVYFKEDLYSGNFFDDAPDLVALPYDGYDLKGSITKNDLAGNSNLTGGHTRENATFYINQKINCDNINIIDVGVIVLRLLGITKGNLEGRPFFLDS